MIKSLTSDGRGLAHIDGKAVLIDGALPGERVSFNYMPTRAKLDEGQVVKILQPAAERVEPECPHVQYCGGCTLQHLHPEGQIRLKQDILLKNLQHQAGIQPEEILPPLHGDIWGYRRKARLGVRDVKRKGRVLVGFREKRRNHYLAELVTCEVLHPSVGHHLMVLSEFIGTLDARGDIAQIEVAVSDENTALVFRHLQVLSVSDRQKLAAFAKAHGWLCYLQSGGVETIKPLSPQQPTLFYNLDEFDIRVEFEPNDFTQVNRHINRQMVSQVLEYLEVDQREHVLDLFCGLGNFTMPLARKAASVTGVEGGAGLVARAKMNAGLNGLENIVYHEANLYKDVENQQWIEGHYDKLLLDPPRSGAWEVINIMEKIDPGRIVYISCHPGTLARDTDVLVNRKGYQLCQAGVMDMFPHTTHIESMAVFEKTG